MILLGLGKTRGWMSYRRGVLSASTWADHASQNLHSINGDVTCGIDGFLSNRFAVDHHFSRGFADGHMKLGEIIKEYPLINDY